MFFEEKGARNPNIPFAARLVEQTANKIFNMAFPQLAAVVIKVSGLPSKIFEDETFAFLHSEQVCPDGKKKYMAVKIEPHMIKHHVACADILEEERFVFAQGMMEEASFVLEMQEGDKAVPCTITKHEAKVKMGLREFRGRVAGIDAGMDG